MLQRFGLNLVLVAAYGVAACGGEAVIDPPLGGGGATSATTTTTTTSVVVSSSSGAVDDPCTLACDSLEECTSFSPGFDCVERCRTASDNAQCGQDHQFFVECAYSAGASLCGSIPGLACSPILEGWLACRGDMAFDDCAVSPQGDCACSTFVSPGVLLQQTCSVGQGCDCMIGDQVVGTCEPNDEECGITDGCCAGVFFTAPI